MLVEDAYGGPNLVRSHALSLGVKLNISDRNKVKYTHDAARSQTSRWRNDRLRGGSRRPIVVPPLEGSVPPTSGKSSAWRPLRRRSWSSHFRIRRLQWPRIDGDQRQCHGRHAPDPRGET